MVDAGILCVHECEHGRGLERDVDHCPQNKPDDIDPVYPQNGLRLLIDKAIISLFQGDLIVEQIGVLEVHKYALLSLAPQGLGDPVTYRKQYGTHRENESS